MDTKICNKCDNELPVDDFRKNTNTCKKCHTSITTAHRENNKDKYKEYYTKAYHERNGREKMKAYRNTEKGRELSRETRKRFNKKNPKYGSERMRYERENVTDNYVKATLRNFGIYDPSPEMIQAKRLQLLILREIKKKKDECREKICN